MRVAGLAGLWAIGCDLDDMNTMGFAGGLAQALVTGRIAGASGCERHCDVP